jgi:transcriptional regulator with GAF, ATPase, and Fis domain
MFGKVTTLGEEVPMSVHARLRASGGIEKRLRPSLKDRIEHCETQAIISALDAHCWNQRRAAASLGLRPTTLHEKMKRLGLLRGRPPSRKAGRGSAVKS